MTAETYEEDIRVLSLFVVNAPAENQTARNLEVVVDTISTAATIAADPQTTVAEEVCYSCSRNIAIVRSCIA